MSESTVKVDTISSYASTNITLSTAGVTRVTISGLPSGSINGITASLRVSVNGLVTCLAGVTVSSGQYASSLAAPTQSSHLCNKTYVDGKIKTPVYGVSGSVSLNQASTAGLTTSSVFPWTYIFPANTFLIHGYCYHNMGSDNGSRLDAQFFQGTTAVATRFAICGGNELPGNDGGRGMTFRPNFVIGVPPGTDRVKFTRGENTTQGGIAANGGGAMTVTINQTVVIS